MTENIAVLEIVNSIVGRPGNIGVRTARVLDVLQARGDTGACLCRAADRRQESFRYRDMGILGHAPRVLNAVRIYLAPKFNHRIADLALFEWFVRKELAGRTGEQKFDLVHLWDVCPELISRFQQKGYPVLLDVPIAPMAYANRLQKGGIPCQLFDDPVLREREINAFLLADHLLAPSEFVAQELASLGVSRNKISVVEFGVDIPEQARSMDDNRNGEGLRFCFAGNINFRKGLNELLQAWSSSASGCDELHLCGRVYPEVKALLANACGGKIYTPGFVNTFQYLRECDVFVFPSWMEGSAKAVYEAMACGLPAIVTHSAGSIVRDGIDGFVIEAGDVGALQERMQWFRDNPELIARMGMSARTRAREYSWERYANKIADIYTTILRTRKCRKPWM